MSQTPTTPLSPTPLNTSFFNVLINNNNNNNLMLQQQLDGLISPTKEEISTIFVVGFPEDMQEREFQNMFIFSPGFEAATLKLPPAVNQSGKYDFEEDSNRKQIVSLVSSVLYEILHVFVRLALLNFALDKKH